MSSKKAPPALAAHLAATAQTLESILRALLKDEANKEHLKGAGKQIQSLRSQPGQVIKQEMVGEIPQNLPRESKSGTLRPGSKSDVLLAGADVSMAPRQVLLHQLDTCVGTSLRTLKAILQRGLPRETALPCLFEYEMGIRKMRRAHFGNMAHKENTMSIKKGFPCEIALSRFIKYEKDVEKMRRVYFGKITNKENEALQQVVGRLTNPRPKMTEEEKRLRKIEREEALKMESMKDFIVKDEEVKSKVGGSIGSQRDEQMDVGMRGDTGTYHLPRSTQVQSTFITIKKEDAPPQARSGEPSGMLQSHPGLDADSDATTVIEKDEQIGHAGHVLQTAATNTANTSPFSNLGAQVCLNAGAALKRKRPISNENEDPAKVAKFNHEVSEFGDIRESLHKRYGENLAKSLLQAAEKRKMEDEEEERKEREKKARRKLKKARRLQRKKNAEHAAMNENAVGDEGQKSVSYAEVDAPVSGHKLSGMKSSTKISLEEIRQERNSAKWGEEFSWLPKTAEGLGNSQSTEDTGIPRVENHQYDASRQVSSMIRQKTPSESRCSEDDSSEEADTSQLLLRPSPSPSPFGALARAMAAQNKKAKNGSLPENDTENVVSDMKIATPQSEDTIPHPGMPGPSNTVAGLISPVPLVSSTPLIETKILCSDNELRPRGDEDEAMLTFISWEREEQQKLGRGGRLNPVATYIIFQSNKLKGSSECMSSDQAAMFVKIVFGIGSAEALVQFKKVLEVMRSEFEVDREYHKGMERFGRASLRAIKALDAGHGDPFGSYSDVMVAIEFFKYLQNSRSSFGDPAAEMEDQKEMLASTHWREVEDLQLDELAGGNNELRTLLCEMRDIGFRFTRLMNIYNPGIMALIPGAGRFGNCLNAIIDMSKAEFNFLCTYMTDKSNADPFMTRSSAALEEYVAGNGMQGALSLPELRLGSQADEAILGLKEKSAQLALLCLPA